MKKLALIVALLAGCTEPVLTVQAEDWGRAAQACDHNGGLARADVQHQLVDSYHHRSALVFVFAHCRDGARFTMEAVQ